MPVAAPVSTATLFDVRPLGGVIGAEVFGCDLRSLDAQGLADLRSLWLDHGVLVIREQSLSETQHIEFAERFGEININRFFTPVDGFPKIAEVRKEPTHQDNIGSSWHTDHSYDRCPAMGSLLYARELPRRGGDTIFACMYAAYEALSSGLQLMLRQMSALHSSRHVFGHSRSSSRQVSDVFDRLHNPDLATQDWVHPVVIQHPESKRLALYVNPGFTRYFDGWSEKDSKPLLDYLYNHASQPQFTCRVQWQPGTLTLWDNRCTWHYAINDYSGERRLMHRITLEGTPLHGAPQDSR